ncbi:MAG: hypothetical protein IPJ41_08720 [Phycisphaerales bacterium]|nr:hypothetical protein [Phycisphaerales bacterium]
MSRNALQRIAVLLACTVPAQALLAVQEHATGHEEVGAIPTVQQGLATGITALVVFFLVLFVLGAKVWPSIAAGLDDRANKIKDEIEAAAAARKQAAAALESYQASLAQARAEAHKMLEDTRAQQQKLAADLKAKADIELGELRDKARRDIEAAKRAALNEIYANATAMATDIAAKILGREVNAADHARLVEES